MLHHLFDAFSIWFFASLALLFLIEIAITENDSPGGALVALLLWLGLAIAFTDFRPWVWPIEHWPWMIAALIGYLICGVGWSIVKWEWHVVDRVGKKYAKDDLDPARSDNKARIVTWMMWWPFSLTWWLCQWPREIFNALYLQMIGTFKRIVDRAYTTN